MKTFLFGLFSVAVSLCAVLVCGEAGVRAGRALDIGPLGDPRSYAHPYCDPDYHKFRVQAQADADVPALRVGGYDQHPVLGWVPGEKLTREMGLVTDDGPARADVALFGDSFTAGVPPTTREERIAARLDALLPGRRVLDYAVSGYGVDQIYLRYLSVVSDERTRPDVAVIGILVDDIDRVIQPVRAAPKPLFVLGDGGLQLRGVPIEQEPIDWLADHPISIRSYLAALVRTRWAEAAEGRGGFYSHCRRDEKEAITRAILESLVGDARHREVELLFVVLYGEMAMKTPSWRTGFLLGQLAALGVPYVDLRPVFMAAAGREEEGLSAFFFPQPNFHPNARGNRLAAEAVARALAGRADPGWSETIDLTRNGTRRVQASGGWHRAEERFTWSASPTASLWLDAEPGRDALLEVEFASVARVVGDPRALTVSVGDTRVAEYVVADLPRGFQGWTLRANVPASALADGGAPVRFQLPYLIRPVDVGLGRDGRALGVAVRSVRLGPAASE
ncbi:MAG: SGNH/GDSL hydrolase family protein [Myxococcota bacterium]